MEPGFYPDLSNAEYHKSKGISKTGLDYIAENPASYIWSMNAPIDQEKLKALDIGKALHCILLEPHVFDDEFVVAPELNLRTNAGKDEWKEFQEVNKDRTIITFDEDKQIRLMRESVMAHPTARWIFEQEGINEGSIYWIDDETGELCKCRPDRMLKDRPLIIDVKKVAGMDRFESHAEEFRYHVQDAMYSEGFHEHFGGSWPDFMFLTVSSTISAGRYKVDVVELPDDWKQAGAEKFRENLNTYHACKVSNDWLKVRTLKRPRWAAYKD